MQVIVNYCRCVVLMLWVMLSGGIYAANSQESSQESQKNSGLTIPEDFNVLYVDGRKYQHNFFSPGGAELELSKGEHRVVMIYDQFFERGDDTDRIKSAPFMVSFVIENRAEYQLGFVVPKTLNAGKDFAKSPQVEVFISTNRSTVPIQVTHNIDKDKYLASYAKEHGKPVLPAQPSTPERSVPETPEVKIVFPASAAHQESRTNESNALQQLNYWWQQADQGQRDEFLQDIKAPVKN